jgi:basic membrane lipoprotein Med (substrate-binding protein (PBP1-ABC) superfamily)
VSVHQGETAYLMGLIAGRMTKTDTVGVVGSFPGDDTNDEVNGFFRGVRDANAKAKRKITYIQSWFDPQKSASATSALASAGADFVLELAPAFEACQTAKIACFGNYVDYSALAPDAVVTSAIANWEPDINFILDQWWAHATASAAYAAPHDQVWYGMARGGTDLAPYHAWEARLPDSLKTEVASAKAKILSGEKPIAIDLTNPVSD